MIISAIVAVARNGIIGKDNNLPWRLPADLAYFKRTTIGHHLILGRKNYQSIGRPLPNRVNVVLSRNAGLEAPGCVVVNTLDAALHVARAAGEEECFIAGGAEIYRLALPLATRLYLTRIEHDYEGDVVMPDLGTGWREVWREEHVADEKNSYPFVFLRFERDLG